MRSTLAPSSVSRSAALRCARYTCASWDSSRSRAAPAANVCGRSWSSTRCASRSSRPRSVSVTRSVPFSRSTAATCRSNPCAARCSMSPCHRSGAASALSRRSSTGTIRNAPTRPRVGLTLEAQPTGMEPLKSAIHRAAANRSRAMQGGTRCVATRTLHGAAQRVGWHASIPRVQCGPAPREQNGAIFALAIRMDSNGGPTAGTGRAVEANAGSGLRCGRTRTSNSRCPLARSRSRCSRRRRTAPGCTKETTVRAQQACACTVVAVTGRMGIIHPRIRDRCSCCSSISRSYRRCGSPSEIRGGIR